MEFKYYKYKTTGNAIRIQLPVLKMPFSESLGYRGIGQDNSNIIVPVGTLLSSGIKEITEDEFYKQQNKRGN